MAKSEWLSVYQYAKKIGKSKQQIYLDIRTGKIPKEQVRTGIIEVKRLQIKVEPEDLTKTT
jgi:predicted DNA-binding transcriptional regulator AlpA